LDPNVLEKKSKNGNNSFSKNLYLYISKTRFQIRGGFWAYYRISLKSMWFIHYIQVAEPESGKTNLATKIVKQLELANLGPDDLYMEVSLIQPNWLR
jgi:hypothetical protein